MPLGKIATYPNRAHGGGGCQKQQLQPQQPSLYEFPLPFWSQLGEMPASKLAVATRAFVGVLLALARAYDLALQVNRDSAHDAILRAYRKVLLEVHPDKGGSHADKLRRKVPQNVRAGHRSWRRWSRQLSA